MCDTIVALPDATADRLLLFGKNSDRERNEAQAVEFMPRAEHAAGTDVACTYIAIPQAPHTHAALLCRPFWMWGAEMGANEHGVVIGNEAVHARMPPQEEPALTGMDLLRLALERATTATEAVEVSIAGTSRPGRQLRPSRATLLSQQLYHRRPT
jgi:secernin